MAYCQITFHLKITTFHGKLMMPRGGNLFDVRPGLAWQTQNCKWPWDIWYRSGNWLGPSLNPISSAIKLGSFLLCLPSHHPLDCQSGGDRERWSFFFSKNSILAFWLMMNSYRNGMRILVKLFVPKPTNDFVTSEIDDHAHRMLKHLITKHLQVWTNTNQSQRETWNNQNSI